MQLLLSALLLLAQASPEAEALWSQGDRVEALAIMEANLAKAPNNGRLRTLLVQRELDLRHFQRAYEFSEKLPQEQFGLRGRALYFLTRYEDSLQYLRLSDRDELLMRAEALRALGRFAELDALLPKLHENLGSDSLNLQMIEARIYLRKKDYKAALPILRQVTARDPLQAEALFNLGRVLVRQGSREEGLELLEQHRLLTPLLDKLDFAKRGVALAPRGGANQAALGDAFRDLIGFDKRLSQKAASAYERGLALATESEITPIALRLARFQKEWLLNSEAATTLLLKTIERHDDLRLRVRAADYYAELDKLDEALALLAKLALERPGDQALQSRVTRWRKQRDSR
ncbi:MAG: tetratricopeptide (TPR) repeat protein [Planctomycetota bacterium]|jgi:tetratricopeptide (TPR) repeat protein